MSESLNIAKNLDRIKQIQLNYLNTVFSNQNSGTISLLQPLEYIFSVDNELMKSYVDYAYVELYKVGLCKEVYYSSCYNLLGHYGVALTGLFFGYELSTGEMKLYTSSISAIKSLRSMGVVVVSNKDLSDLENKLYGTDRILRSFKDGNKLVSIRLDLTYINGVAKFIPKIPRTYINLTDYMIIDYNCVTTTYNYLDNLMKTNVLKVVQGSKVRYVSKNIDVLRKIYGNERVKWLLSFKPIASELKFYVPSLGASIYTSGITNIDLDKVDRIEFIKDINDIDLSNIKLSYYQAKDYCISNIDKLSKNEIMILSLELGLSSNTNINELAVKIKSMYDSDVYNFMKSHPEYFDLNVYKQLPNKYGNNYKVYTKGNLPDAMTFRRMLSQDIFKVLLINKYGKFSTIICTNSTSHLKRLLGDKYYNVYESDNNRLRALRKLAEIISNNGNIDTKVFKKHCLEYNLGYFVDFLNSDMIEFRENKQINTNKLVEYIDAHIRNIDRHKKLSDVPSLITVRSCEAYKDKDGNVHGFYKNINMNSVVSIVQLT